MHSPHIAQLTPHDPRVQGWPSRRRHLHRTRRVGSFLTTVVEGFVAAAVGFTAGVLIMSLMAPADALPWRQELSNTAQQETPTPTLMMLEEGEDPALLDRELRELEQEQAPAGG